MNKRITKILKAEQAKREELLKKETSKRSVIVEKMQNEVQLAIKQAIAKASTGTLKQARKKAQAEASQKIRQAKKDAVADMTEMITRAKKEAQEQIDESERASND